MKKFKSIDAYIEAQPKEVRASLRLMRKTIHAAAPEAEEVISYGMPAFKYHGILAYFASFKNHIGFFPTASGVKAFKKELSKYECSKGTVRIPFGEPLPLGLIRKIIKFRVKENLSKLKK